MRATWTRQLIGFALTAVLGITFATAPAAQAPEPIVGTWKLDAAKSTFKPGPGPKSATVVISAEGKGLKVAIDGVGPDGGPMKWGYSNQRDGKDTPVTGHPLYDTAALTQTSPTEGMIVYKKAGKTVVTGKTSVSSDGKTLTVTQTGTGPDGQAVSNVGIYTRQ